MEPRAHSLDEELLIAEHAAEWLLRAQTADAREKERLLAWLSRSPQHSGELLAAASMDLAMRHVFRRRLERIDVNRLLAASGNVLTLRDSDPRLSGNIANKRSRMLVAASLGFAATIVALVVAPSPVRSWLHACDCGTALDGPQVVELAEGSALAIDAGSGVLVIFAASVRDAEAAGARPMLASGTSSPRPLRMRVIAAASAGPELSRRLDVQALGARPNVLSAAGRVGQSPLPAVLDLRAMNPWDRTIVLERRGNDILIR